MSPSELTMEQRYKAVREAGEMRYREWRTARNYWQLAYWSIAGLHGLVSIILGVWGATKDEKSIWLLVLGIAGPFLSLTLTISKPAECYRGYNAAALKIRRALDQSAGYALPEAVAIVQVGLRDAFRYLEGIDGVQEDARPNA